MAAATISDFRYFRHLYSFNVGFHPRLLHGRHHQDVYVAELGSPFREPGCESHALGTIRDRQNNFQFA